MHLYKYSNEFARTKYLTKYLTTMAESIEVMVTLHVKTIPEEYRGLHWIALKNRRYIVKMTIKDLDHLQKDSRMQVHTQEPYHLI